MESRQTGPEGVAMKSVQDLLDARGALLRKYLDEGFESIASGAFDDTNSFDIDPVIESDADLEKFWWTTISRFEANDPNLQRIRRYTTEDRINSVRDHVFGRSVTGGVMLLMVGSYHTDIFNNQGVVDAAEALLERVSDDEYQLITACGEEVMLADDGKGGYENKFLELIFREKYQRKVFPVKLKERPEFHCYAAVTKCREADGAERTRFALGFEPHHSEGQEIRRRLTSNNQDNVMMAFRSFFRHLKAAPGEIGYHAGVTYRKLSDYRLYLPEFFFMFRSVPKHVLKHIDIDSLLAAER